MDRIVNTIRPVSNLVDLFYNRTSRCCYNLIGKQSIINTLQLSLSFDSFDAY